MVAGARSGGGDAPAAFPSVPTISVAVQHHPSRRELLPRLLDPLAGLAVEIVQDTTENDGIPSAWRTYRRALERTPEWATHRLVIQDDAQVCRNFAVALRLAVGARPDRLLVLCVCGVPSRSARLVRAAAGTQAWVELPPEQWVPVIAVVWPARLIRPALRWIDRQPWPSQFRADDEIVGRVARALGERVLACAPSIVHHDDQLPSLVGRRAAYGRNSGRVTACWIGDCDPLEIPWRVGAP